MQERLIIQIGPDDTGPVRWCAVDDDGRVTVAPRSGVLRDAAADAAGRRVVVLVPGTEVLLSRVAVPARNRRQLAQAVPYVLEERLADDVENLHFALGPRGTGGDVPVAVVARSKMAQWIEGLRAAGIEADVLLPDFLAVPGDADEWGLLVATGRAALRTGPLSGLGLDRDNLPALLAAALHECGNGKPARIRVYSEPAGSDGALGLDTAGDSIRVVHETLREDVTAWLARRMPAEAPLNLLQGPYSVRETGPAPWRPWLPAAAMLALWALAQAGGELMEYRRLQNEEERLDRRIAQIFRETFPGARLVNPRAQMEQRLAALRGKHDTNGAGFFTLLTHTGRALHAVQGVELRGLSYRNGRLELDISAQDIGSIEKLKQRLSATPGLAVEMESAATRGGRAHGRLNIRSEHS